LRTAFFVDGYNVFYSLVSGTPYKWLNLKALLGNILARQNPQAEVSRVCYFTSSVKPHLASRGTDSLEAQNTYIRALKANDVEVITGLHLLSPARAPRHVAGQKPSRQDLVDIWSLEEKQTDVNIAIGMYRAAVSQQYDQVVLVSADTDMTGALKAIKEDFPAIKRGVIFPHKPSTKRPAPVSLCELADWVVFAIHEKELAEAQFSNRVPTHKKPAVKPHYW